MTYAMKLAAPLLLATLTSAQVAQAGSATGTMNVSGNVQGSCTVSAVALNFGSITPGSATDAEGSISAACTTGSEVTFEGAEYPSYVIDFGEVFFEDLPASTTLKVTMGEESCETAIEFPPTDDLQPTLGPFTCS